MLSHDIKTKKLLKKLENHNQVTRELSKKPKDSDWRWNVKWKEAETYRIGREKSGTVKSERVIR
jgi:hypothetical protein